MKQIDSFEDFWEVYRTLQWKFMEGKKDAIVSHLETSMGVVNGLTDGWYMLRKHLMDMRKMWPSQFNGEAKDLSDTLIQTLDRWLK